MSAKKKVQFDKASATSKVRLERIKKIYEDCGWKRVIYLLEKDG